MKRVLSAALLCFALVAAAGIPVLALTATPTASTVLVNGESVAFDAYLIEDNNYFKLRDLAFILNGTEKQFNVGWDGAANAITLTSGQPYTAVGGEMEGKGSGALTPVPTSAKIIKDGAEISFTAYNIGNNNFFRLRDIGAAFDFGVDWDGARNTIVIDTSKGYTPEAEPPAPPAPVSASGYGNTQGNLVNRGSAAIQGDWIYYATSGGELWKVKTDGTGRTKLTDGLFEAHHYINIADDWIYYWGHIGDRRNRYYRIRTDGTGKAEISREERAFELNGSRQFNDFNLIVDGWWYGVGTGDVRGDVIYRISHDGKHNAEMIVSCDIHFCLHLVGVVGDAVYYTHREGAHHPENWEDYPPKLYKISAGDKEGTTVAVDVSTGNHPVIYDGWVYYVNDDNHNSSLYKVRTDGTGKTTLISNVNVGYFNVSNGWIYYGASSRGDTFPAPGTTGLIKMRTDRTGATSLYIHSARHINIVGDWIFFQDDSNGKSYQIRTNGTGLQEV